MNHIRKVVIDEMTVRALFEIEIDNLIKLTKDDLVWNVNEGFLKYCSEYSDEDAELPLKNIFEKKEIEFELFSSNSSVGRNLIRMLEHEDNSYDIDTSSYPIINFKLSEINKESIHKKEYEKYKCIFTDIEKETFISETNFYKTLLNSSNSGSDGFIYYAKDTNIYMLNHKRIFEINKININKIVDSLKDEKREIFDKVVIDAKKELNHGCFKKDIAEYEMKEISKNLLHTNDNEIKRKRRI